MVSLIMTVKNEVATLPAWLESIKAQTIQPDEIVIVDGGSTDGTWVWLEQIASATLHVFQHAGNIAEGRNTAIREAKGDVIVATDAGCTYEPNWLASIIAPLQSNEADFVTTGFGPWFQTEDSWLVHGIASTTIPAPREFAKPWTASSRSVAFRKKIWEQVGGYPEWIPFCEDVIFDLKVQKTAAREKYLPQPLVRWRPRASWGSYWRQLYNYVRSNGHGKLYYGRQVARFEAYIALIALVVLVVMDWRWGIVLLVVGSAYCLKFWLRWFAFTAGKPIVYRLAGIFLVPLLVAFGDIAKMCGWVTGCIERHSGLVKYQPW